MKHLLLALFLLTSPRVLLGQGTLYFYNYAPNVGLDSPVFNTDGAPLMGYQFRAQLYAGSSGASLNPVGLPADFSVPTPGYWSSSGPESSLTRVIPGVAAGEVAYAQVRVWSILLGQSYDQVAAAGGKRGESTIFTVTTGSESQGGSGVPGFPGYMTEFKSFTLVGDEPAVPEPTTMAFGVVGAMVWIVKRFGRKRRGNGPEISA